MLFEEAQGKGQNMFLGANKIVSWLIHHKSGNVAIITPHAI
jgi:hypothetical protein